MKGIEFFKTIKQYDIQNKFNKHLCAFLLIKNKHVQDILLEQLFKHENSLMSENCILIVYSLSLTVGDFRRVSHELFLTKGVPHQISAGLEILRKIFLAWKFLQFEEHSFL